MKVLKRILKSMLILLSIVVGLVMLLLMVLTITEYKPDDTEKLEITAREANAESADIQLQVGESYNIITWNIGYGALGEDADFFMDGGKSVRAKSKETVLANMDSINQRIEEMSPDILLLQEVDEKSSRSKKVNEKEIIQSTFANYCSSYAYNYKTLMVPYPIPPLGRVASGIMTLSKFDVQEATRVQLPCPFSYPVRLCNLKRCLLISRIPISGSDKELVIVNVHLEAYDNGEGKIAQTKMLADLLKAEVDAGNYVIAGGDFNQTFSNTDVSAYKVQSDDLWKPSDIDVTEFGDSLICLTDPSTPTCRSLDRPLKGNENNNFQYYMIDGFIVSSNITINSIETIDTGFTVTDHNPIEVIFVLE